MKSRTFPHRSSALRLLILCHRLWQDDPLHKIVPPKEKNDEA